MRRTRSVSVLYANLLKGIMSVGFEEPIDLVEIGWKCGILMSTLEGIQVVLKPPCST
jgi:hypothetical protein